MEQDLKALNAAEQAFELNGDDSGVKALQRKYSDCSQEVWNMYEEYEKEYREVQRAGICKIDQESFEGFLDRMGDFWCRLTAWRGKRSRRNAMCR